MVALENTLGKCDLYSLSIVLTNVSSIVTGSGVVGGVNTNSAPGYVLPFGMAGHMQRVVYGNVFSGDL